MVVLDSRAIALGIRMVPDIVEGQAGTDKRIEAADMEEVTQVVKGIEATAEDPGVVGAVAGKGAVIACIFLEIVVDEGIVAERGAYTYLRCQAIFEPGKEGQKA